MTDPVAILAVVGLAVLTLKSRPAARYQWWEKWQRMKRGPREP